MVHAYHSRKRASSRRNASLSIASALCRAEWISSAVNDFNSQLYPNNELATGHFSVLGRRIDLATVTTPVYLLAARDDHVVAPAQALAVRRLVGTRAAAIRQAVAPCGHLGLFMGRRTLANEWREIGRWLTQPDAALSGPIVTASISATTP